jgi:hypothetical protein
VANVRKIKTASVTEKLMQQMLTRNCTLRGNTAVEPVNLWLTLYRGGWGSAESKKAFRQLM